MPLVHVNGVDLYFELHGAAAGPPVLNISGSGGDLRFTFPERLALNDRFRVLSYDQRGLGRSGHLGGDVRASATGDSAGAATMAEYADDAAALVRHHGWERCSVMGTSFGGMVALHLAIRHPDLIERMVLNCTSPGGAHRSYPLHEIGDMPTEDLFALRMRLNDVRWDPDAGEPIPGLGPIYRGIAEQAKSGPRPETRAGLARQLTARASHDVEADLDGIATPTLVCAGRHDGMAPVANSEFLATTMPNARLEVFDGGHLFFLQDRTAYPTIIDFFENGAQ